MKVIKDVEEEEVRGDYVDVPHHERPDFFEGGLQAVNPYMEIETVEGQTFVNEKGEKVVLGATKKVEEAIGLPFKALENQQKEIENLFNLLSK